MNDNQLSQQAIQATSSINKKLEKLGLHTRFDLILHIPLRYEDETHIYPIKDAQIGKTVLVEGDVTLSEVQHKPRKQLLVRIKDGTGELILRFIHFYPSQQRQLALGKRIRALGDIRHGFFGDEMVHPKLREVDQQSPLAECLTPVYSSVSGLSQTTLRRLIQREFKSTELIETLPKELLSKLGLVSFTDAVNLLHFPPPEYNVEQLLNQNLPAWQRLKFDELLAQQISMCITYRQRRQGKAPIMQSSGALCQSLINMLPFALTSAQKKVISEIKHDLNQAQPMHRLLQGDVGSGKTIVAALLALKAIESGFQVALMAPTEILAEQHYIKLKIWFDKLGLKTIWLSGSLGKKTKLEAIQSILNNESSMIIGTHALFQKDVEFAKLGLIIIDEQHRFGVSQRIALKAKGIEPHQLMMSATPIPRTLAMSFFADLDVSVIDELPPGRTPIKTQLIKASRRAQIEQHVRKICKEGKQAYWVCPLIEESETLQLQTAVDTHSQLAKELSELNIGLLHGRMKSGEKAKIMSDFSSGKIHVLVATTVIEVGVDVPNASLMVIEHAERMGLSQLHQLRGRVGRGSAKSSCILIFSEPLSDIAKMRLKVIYEQNDGFEIAQQDLNIRGPGEFLGARQSGIPLLRFAKLEQDLHLLEQARYWAPILLKSYPEYAAAHLARWLSGREHFLSA